MQEQEAPYPTESELPEANTAAQEEKKKSKKRKSGPIIPSDTPNTPNPVIENNAYLNHAADGKNETTK